MTISEDRVKQNCFPSTISNVTNDKNELRKTVSLASFQKPQLQSVSIFKFAIRADLKKSLFRGSFIVLN